jgi:WD40 repeat protein
MAMNSDHVLLGGEEGSIRVWNLISTEEIEKHVKENPVSISSIVASEGGRIVSGDKDGVIVCWGVPS